jgi:hypothetical protein
VSPAYWAALNCKHLTSPQRNFNNFLRIAMHCMLDT